MPPALIQQRFLPSMIPSYESQKHGVILRVRPVKEPHCCLTLHRQSQSTHLKRSLYETRHRTRAALRAARGADAPWAANPSISSGLPRLLQHVIQLPRARLAAAQMIKMR